MVKFEHANGNLKTAVFGGSMADICADICLELSLVYASMYNHDPEMAKTFRRKFVSALIDPEIADKVFSTELYDAIKDSGQFAMGTLAVDKDELSKQLREILE